MMRPIRLLSLTLALAWMGTIFFLSHQPSLPVPSLFPDQDKLFHACTYGLLSLFYLGSLPLHRPGHPAHQVLIAAMLATLYGVTDEFHQSFIPGRSADVWDVLADATGALLCAGLARMAWRFRQAGRFSSAES